MDVDRKLAFQEVGYSVGTTVGGEWLTVPGSALYLTYLFDTRDEAWAEAEHRGWFNIINSVYICRRVVRKGTWFRIIEEDEEDVIDKVVRT